MKPQNSHNQMSVGPAGSKYRIKAEYPCSALGRYCIFIAICLFLVNDVNELPACNLTQEHKTSAFPICQMKI